jgi:hypothetical protein
VNKEEFSLVSDISDPSAVPKDSYLPLAVVTVKHQNIPDTCGSAQRERQLPLVAAAHRHIVAVVWELGEQLQSGVWRLVLIAESVAELSSES